MGNGEKNREGKVKELNKGNKCELDKKKICLQNDGILFTIIHCLFSLFSLVLYVQEVLIHFTQYLLGHTVHEKNQAEAFL